VAAVAKASKTLTETAEARAKRLANLKPFVKGKSGNPAGREKGSRNKLSEAFLADVCAEWERNGIEALRKVREDDPSTFIKVVASLIPKEVTGDNGGPLQIVFVNGDINL
jgi:hypothetical protein